MKMLKCLLYFCIGSIACLSFISNGYALEDENNSLPLGLPPIPWPKNNPYSPEKVELGRLLFFDKRLSSDGTVSCASCHSLEYAFSDPSPVSIGINNSLGGRHAPTIINSAYQKRFFWDGRALTLEEQSKGPIANPMEMTTCLEQEEAYRQCEERIRSIPTYANLFTSVFGTEDCSIDQVAFAIASFERTIVSGNSAYDRYQAGDKTAMTDLQILGMEVFQNSGCASCHFGSLFTNGNFANIGIGMDQENPDLGRYIITQQEKDWGAFKVPGLREASQRKYYMHDGSLQSLEEVIEYYNQGGIQNKNLHRLIRPLHLSTEEKAALVAFLHALDGEGWQQVEMPNEYPN